MSKQITRRALLRASAASGLGVYLPGRRGFGQERSPNERPNVACIGLGNQSRANLGLVAKHANIVALCDVDPTRTAMFADKFPRAATFADFRILFDKIEKSIDAVVVTTPNHSHAAIALPAMKMGKHVYCEKPLTRTVREARAMAEAAERSGVVTQMGTQIHAGENYRRCVELIRAGAVGLVRDVHVWFGKPGGFRRFKHVVDRPAKRPPIPSGLDWDLWIGPAAMRPFHPCYHPHDWHYWWDFGNGTLGNMAPHFMDLVFWSLGLRSPGAIHAVGPAVHPESTPFWLECRWDYPARGEMPPVRVTWHHGRGCPPIVEKLGASPWGAGVLFVGDDGVLAADYDRRVLLPEKKFADFQPPDVTIANSVGCHRREWVEACKGNGRALCDFDYASKLTETLLLGNIAYRAGKRLEWNATAMSFPNCPEADGYLHSDYREGWKLD